MTPSDPARGRCRRVVVVVAAVVCRFHRGSTMHARARALSGWLADRRCGAFACQRCDDAMAAPGSWWLGVWCSAARARRVSGRGPAALSTKAVLLPPARAAQVAEVAEVTEVAEAIAVAPTADRSR